MLKKHKMLVEFVAKEETELGAIDLVKSAMMMKNIGALAKKNGFDAYIKGQKKEVIDYVPTKLTYRIKTTEDIAKLTPDQFEMFVEDLRNWCNTMRTVLPLIEIGIVKNDPGIIWIDSGLHEEKISFSVTNKA